MIENGISTSIEKEKAVLVAIAHAGQPADKVQEFLEELEFLSKTLGVESIKQFTQRVDKPHPGTFIGKGKAEEIRTYVRAKNVDLVHF